MSKSAGTKSDDLNLIMGDQFGGRTEPASTYCPLTSMAVAHVHCAGMCLST